MPTETGRPPTPMAPADRPVNLLSRIRSEARRDQLICMALIVIFLLCIFVIQPFIDSQRAGLVVSNDKNMGSLFLTFPRLTLGGFRGILVTVLWETAENDKNNRNWVPLESDYNAIAMLEPYFSSDYIFNGWNLSYNLSAQWHDENSKYKWVLDGLLYLYQGEKYIPNDSNIIMNEGNDFFLKLGTSFEREYYCSRWRFDIANMYRYDPKSTDPQLSTLAEVKAIVDQPQFNAVWLPALDEKGPVGHGIKVGDVEYRYGVSPFYFAYVEFQRALKQPKAPENMGSMVLHFWPAMSLRLWCRDDIYYATHLTYRIFGEETQEQMLQDFNDRAQEVRDCYRNVVTNAPLSIDEFKTNLFTYPDQQPVHDQHIAEVQYYQALGDAELTLFNALVQWQINNRQFRLGDDADVLFASASDKFVKAQQALSHYLDVAYPNFRNGAENPERAQQQEYVDAL
ncbi:MAG TPA: hypothetical protein VKJ65_10350, partial [Phycisphaerae bacterium]|nr:hypothetical protein [Phycisphaerae bacterium]